MIELHRNLRGGSEADAIHGLDALFTETFKHGMNDASYEEGAHLTAQLLAARRDTPTSKPDPNACPECKQIGSHSAGCSIGKSFQNLPGVAIAKPEVPAPAKTETSVTATAVVSGDVMPFSEAPYSYNSRWISPHGSIGQHTFRAATFKGYTERLEQLEKYLMEHGYTPAEKAAPTNSDANEQAPLCAVHNKPMTKRSKDGRSWWSCSEKLSDGQYCQYRPKSK